MAAPQAVERIQPAVGGHELVPQEQVAVGNSGPREILAMHVIPVPEQLECQGKMAARRIERLLRGAEPVDEPRPPGTLRGRHCRDPRHQGLRPSLRHQLGGAPLAQAGQRLGILAVDEQHGCRLNLAGLFQNFRPPAQPGNSLMLWLAGGLGKQEGTK